ncbi:MAG: GLPGLI family protein [Bacteroides sp.]|nr:GLPGLI family protein [Bacteroides sp.]
MSWYIKLSILAVIFGFGRMSASIIEPKEPGLLEITYHKVWTYDTTAREANKVFSEDMKLRVGATSAMFYPPKKLYYDSLLTNNFEMAEELLRAMNPQGQKFYNSPGGHESEYVFRNVREGKTLVYNKIGGDRGYYLEDTEKPEWEILDETKDIMGYECIAAKCRFRGREWTAWFTPEIPVKEGPWKLYGLPGLILEAYDTHHDYSFTATGLTDKNVPEVGIFIYTNSDPFVYRSRINVLKRQNKEELQGNYVMRMQATYGKPGTTTKHRSHYDFAETDYPHD